MYHKLLPLGGASPEESLVQVLQLVTTNSSKVNPNRHSAQSPPATQTSGTARPAFSYVNLPVSSCLTGSHCPSWLARFSQNPVTMSESGGRTQLPAASEAFVSEGCGDEDSISHYAGGTVVLGRAHVCEQRGRHTREQRGRRHTQHTCVNKGGSGVNRGDNDAIVLRHSHA